MHMFEKSLCIDFFKNLRSYTVYLPMCSERFLIFCLLHPLPRLYPMDILYTVRILYTVSILYTGGILHMYKIDFFFFLYFLCNFDSFYMFSMILRCFFMVFKITVMVSKVFSTVFYIYNIKMFCIMVTVT